MVNKRWCLKDVVNLCIEGYVKIPHVKKYLEPVENLS